MPEWVAELLRLSPQLGVAVLLAWILFRVWDRATVDRASYEQGLRDAQQRYNEELERVNRRIAELEADLKAEREARLRAEKLLWKRAQGE